ncbi:hypothetical protein HHK36_013685 [Tetracentron sinense]|uniref:Small nuclear ribonucleoprotein E n=1 Tax=Tetracentron sinense TaxID=13715 RepID=A0A834ZDV4_TETSI|nr:hypothetical protein HHK36_013685 [Tetracentron sinense]
MATTRVQRIMTQPINLIFRFLQSKARIQIWLFEQKDLRIEGRIIGFDEYMNLVLEDAEEVNVKKNSRKVLGGEDPPERRQHHSNDEHGKMMIILGILRELTSLVSFATYMETNVFIQLGYSV